MPKLAQEAHERAMDSTVEAALREAGISQEQLEGVAVTIGPGLSLCLQVLPLPACLSTLEIMTPGTHLWTSAVEKHTHCSLHKLYITPTFASVPECSQRDVKP